MLSFVSLCFPAPSFTNPLLMAQALVKLNCQSPSRELPYTTFTVILQARKGQRKQSNELKFRVPTKMTQPWKWGCLLISGCPILL